MRIKLLSAFTVTTAVALAACSAVETASAPDPPADRPAMEVDQVVAAVDAPPTSSATLVDNAEFVDGVREQLVAGVPLAEVTLPDADTFDVGTILIDPVEAPTDLNAVFEVVGVGDDGQPILKSIDPLAALRDWSVTFSNPDAAVTGAADVVSVASPSASLGAQQGSRSPAGRSRTLPAVTPKCSSEVALPHVEFLATDDKMLMVQPHIDVAVNHDGALGAAECAIEIPFLSSEFLPTAGIRLCSNVTLSMFVSVVVSGSSPGETSQLSGTWRPGFVVFPGFDAVNLKMASSWEPGTSFTSLFGSGSVSVGGTLSASAGACAGLEGVLEVTASVGATGTIEVRATWDTHVDAFDKVTTLTIGPFASVNVNVTLTVEVLDALGWLALGFKKTLLERTLWSGEWPDDPEKWAWTDTWRNPYTAEPENLRARISSDLPSLPLTFTWDIALQDGMAELDGFLWEIVRDGSPYPQASGRLPAAARKMYAASAAPGSEFAVTAVFGIAGAHTTFVSIPTLPTLETAPQTEEDTEPDAVSEEDPARLDVDLPQDDVSVDPPAVVDDTPDPDTSVDSAPESPVAPISQFFTGEQLDCPHDKFLGHGSPVTGRPEAGWWNTACPLLTPLGDVMQAATGWVTPPAEWADEWRWSGWRLLTYTTRYRHRIGELAPRTAWSINAAIMLTGSEPSLFSAAGVLGLGARFPGDTPTCVERPPYTGGAGRVDVFWVECTGSGVTSYVVLEDQLVDDPEWNLHYLYIGHVFDPSSPDWAFG